jgi:hypothetical protein
MMNQQELFKEISQLPLSEQLEIVEKIRLRAEHSADEQPIESNGFTRESTIDDRIAIALDLAGSLKPTAGFTPMTRDEEREIIEEYLAEKYS